MSRSIQTRQHRITLSGLADEDEAELTWSEPEPDVELVVVSLRVAKPDGHEPIDLAFGIPSHDVQAHWNPTTFYNRGNDPEWRSSYASRAQFGAPAHVLHAFSGENRLTFALSDGTTPVVMKAGLREETAQFDCVVRLLAPTPPGGEAYRATLRIDRRPLAFHRCLADVARWWGGMPGQVPLPVPDVARLPMLSTWYSFHQGVNAAAVERECLLAKEIGCDTVITDDGWQSDSTARTYETCGDWEPAPSKFPDMAAHVARVHALGMKYMLWYALPFVGRHSRALKRFEGKLLNHFPHWGVYVLDPRFPEVRDYLATTLETAVRTWDLDGLKLDFIDSFDPPAGQVAESGGGRDIDAIPQAVVRLLEEIQQRVTAIKPDALFEFRQRYIGPVMRRLGNIFRAHDVPDDPLGNRVETLDLRLLARDTAVHADMIMWNPDAPVQSAALQFIATLFAVPQISVRIADLRADHREMLTFWLGFWRAHRATLLDGTLEPARSDANFSQVRARSGSTEIVVCYSDRSVAVREVPGTLILVNGTPGAGLIIDGQLGARTVEVRDCRGRVLSLRDLGPGELTALEIPSAGMATLRRS